MARRQDSEDPRDPAVRRPWWWRFSPANPDFRDEVESYGASVLFHLLLLFLLGVVTLSGGGGKGDRVGEGAEGQMAEGAIDSALSAQALEEIMKKEQVKPLETDLPRPNPQKVAPQLSQLARSAPKQLSAAGIGGGYGGGVGMGIGKDFGDFLGLLKRAGFDCVFVIDATGSMKYVIDEVGRKVTRLVDMIQKLVPVARVGLVLYQDHDDPWVVRKSDLTFHGSKLQAFLAGLEAGAAGGDWEEAMKEGLEAAVNGMSWRQRSKKIIVLVADAPPRKADLPTVHGLVDSFVGRGGVVSTIDVADWSHAEFERALHRSIYGSEPDEISPLPAFYKETQDILREISRRGKGEMVALDDGGAIVREIMIAAFGKEWESKVAQYAKDL